MDEVARQQREEANQELVRREMERKSLDTIRVYNPYDFPFKYKWDSRVFSVRPKGTDDIERYRAEAYRHKIVSYMIGQDQLKKGEELLKLRQEQYGKTYLDSYEENKEVWDRVPRLNDPELIDAYTQIVILGKVRDYGMEEFDEQEERKIEKFQTPFDDTSLFERRLIDDQPLEPLAKEGAHV